MSAPDHEEATVVINGRKLTQPQSMALRCAVAHMLFDMQDPLALGDDEHGRAMVKGYQFRLGEVQELIFRKATT